MTTIPHDKFYLCDNADPQHAFIVCGRCLDQSDRDPALYDPLDPLPESRLRKGYTRVCFACERDAQELRNLTVGAARK